MAAGLSCNTTFSHSDCRARSTSIAGDSVFRVLTRFVLRWSATAEVPSTSAEASAVTVAPDADNGLPALASGAGRGRDGYGYRPRRYFAGHQDEGASAPHPQVTGHVASVPGEHRRADYRDGAARWPDCSGCHS
jgi:hypothetical protein